MSRSSLDISLSLKINRDLDLALDSFGTLTKRERACSVRYLLEVGLAAYQHQFAEPLLSISSLVPEK